MKKFFLKPLALVLVMVMLLLTVGCGTEGQEDSSDVMGMPQSTGNTTTSIDANGNVITEAPSTTTSIDANGNVVTEAPSTTTSIDANGNVVTQAPTTGGTKTNVTTTTTTNKQPIGNTVPYTKPSGAYNYVKDIRGYANAYSGVGKWEESKNLLTLTTEGGPAYFGNIYMDASESYVVRVTVTPGADGQLARIIFKGNTQYEHMYLALHDGYINVYDCAGVYPGNAFVPIEILSYSSPNGKEFSFKPGKSYDVVILTTATTVSVWVDGKQYINNMKQSDLKDEGAVAGGRAEPGTDITKYKMSRYEVDDTYLGAYYIGKGSMTMTNFDFYYTTAGLDKSYIDDGSDTNYQSTYKQDKFYIGGSINGFPMGDNGKKTAEIVKLLKDANVNLVIPYDGGTLMENPDKFYGELEKQGVDFIALVDSIYGRNGIKPAQIEKDVKAMSAKYSKLIGYYIWDEPTNEKFWKVRRIGQLVTKNDPSAAVFTALLPSYSGYTWTTTDANYKYANHISNFISKVKPNVISMDYYPFQQHGLDANMKTNNFWKDLGYLTYQANKNNTPFWMWISGLQEWEFGKSDLMTMEHMKAQINGSLAYGVKGVLIFCLNECIIKNDATKSSKYDGMTQLNKETQNIGNLLFNAKRTAIYHTAGYTTPASAYLDDMKKSTLIASAPTAGNGLIISTFTEGSKTYLVVYNKEYSKAVTGTIKLKDSYKIASFNAATNKMGAASAATNQININLGKAGIQVYELTK